MTRDFSQMDYVQALEHVRTIMADCDELPSIVILPPGYCEMDKPTHRELDDGSYEVTYHLTILGPMIGEGI